MNRYLGSKSLETSVANKEIVPESPESWTHGYKIRKLSMMNSTECTIVINGATELFLQARQGFSMDFNDAPITSLIIKESGVKYNFIASF